MNPLLMEEQLGQLLDRYARRADTTEMSFAVSSPKDGFHWSWQQDGARRQFFIASATKLLTAAVVMQLRREGKVDLDEPAARFLGPGELTGLPFFKGEGYGERVTVRQLLAQTSGIGDYFEQRGTNKRSLLQEILAEDQAWTYEDALARAQSIPAKFAPGSSGKAHYSDTNYQLLGRIIENVTGVSYERAVRERVIEPLGLTETFLFTEETLGRYPEIAGMLNGTRPVEIPRAMASFKADGGLVSTAEESLTFLMAFMQGRLFPAEYLQEMTAEWNRIFFPLEYGMGIMRFALPRIFSPVRPHSEMIGHSGASGAVLFYVPAQDLYVTGTINQIKKRALSFQLMTRIVMACRDGER